MPKILVCICVCLLGLVACGTSDASPGNTVPPTDTDCNHTAVTAGTVATGQLGTKVAVLSLTPSPPARFNNSWTVTVTDAAGKARADATLRVTASMPLHGHTAEVPTDPKGDGSYLLAPISLWMPGHWELRITLEGTALEDQVLFNVCIPE